MKPTWLDDIVASMMSRQGRAHLEQLAWDLERKFGRDIATIRETISNTVHRYSSDGSEYVATNPNLFFSVSGLGSGEWGLREWPEKPDLSFQKWEPNDRYELHALAVLKIRLDEAGKAKNDYDRNEFQILIDRLIEKIGKASIDEFLETQPPLNLDDLIPEEKGKS